MMMMVICHLAFQVFAALLTVYTGH